MHVRCSSCQARRKLSMHPDSYSSPGRVPKCNTPGCWSRTRRRGLQQRWYIDKWRAKHEVGPAAPKPCSCPEYHFPHRRGSGWCIHNSNITAEDCRLREEGQ